MHSDLKGSCSSVGSVKSFRHYWALAWTSEQLLEFCNQTLALTSCWKYEWFCFASSRSSSNHTKPKPQTANCGLWVSVGQLSNDLPDLWNKLSSTQNIIGSKLLQHKNKKAAETVVFVSVFRIGESSLSKQGLLAPGHLPSIFIHLHVYIYTYIYMYNFMYVYICIYVQVCIYTYIYKYIYINNLYIYSCICT